MLIHVCVIFSESEPLIEDEAEDWKENQDWEQEADDRENSDPNKVVA